jgi:hypothetical protein
MQGYLMLLMASTANWHVFNDSRLWWQVLYDFLWKVQYMGVGQCFQLLQVGGSLCFPNGTSVSSILYLATLTKTRLKGSLMLTQGIFDGSQQWEEIGWLQTFGKIQNITGGVSETHDALNHLFPRFMQLVNNTYLAVLHWGSTEHHDADAV